MKGFKGKKNADKPYYLQALYAIFTF